MKREDRVAETVMRIEFLKMEGVRVEQELAELVDNARERGLQVCRSCSCTELTACDPPCWWVEPDLCSACQRTGDEGLVERARSVAVALAAGTLEDEAIEQLGPGLINELCDEIDRLDGLVVDELKKDLAGVNLAIENLAQIKEAVQLLGAVAMAAERLRDEPHHVVFKKEGWELEHNLPCRVRRMVNCEHHKVIKEWATATPHDDDLGRYVFELDDVRGPRFTRTDSSDAAKDLLEALAQLDEGAER